MRNIAFGLGLMAVSACAVGTAVELTEGAPQWGVVNTVAFSRDDRPVDGILVQLILTRTQDGKYDASKRTVTSGFGGQARDTTELLVNHLDCRNSRSQADSLNSVLCSVDTRPVDGPLVELFFDQSRSGQTGTTYSARMILTPSGFGGDTTPRTTAFGDGFKVTISN